MITFILIILVCLLYGICMWLFNRISALETAIIILQYDKGVDAIGHSESYR